MPKLYLLGTGAAVSDPHRTTTMLALENDEGIVLIDCGGDALQRLAQAGGDPRRVQALIVTHEHADHVSGFPLLMEKIWLYGRREPLPVYGIETAIGQARTIHDSFDTSTWPGYPDVSYREVAYEEGAVVLEEFGWSISATPGRHTVPCVGLRATDQASGRSVGYSCDTSPDLGIARLARDTELFVHEASGAIEGHSDAPGAARVAREGLARELLLVHLPPRAQLDEAQLERAREIFPQLRLGEEACGYEF